MFAAAQVVSRRAWFRSNAQYWRVLAGLAVFDEVSMTPVDRNGLRKALLRSGDSAEAVEMSRSRPLRMAPAVVLQLVAPDVIGALIDRSGGVGVVTKIVAGVGSWNLGKVWRLRRWQARQQQVRLFTFRGRWRPQFDSFASWRKGCWQLYLAEWETAEWETASPGGFGLIPVLFLTFAGRALDWAGFGGRRASIGSGRPYQ